jgi:hypothetical protein
MEELVMSAKGFINQKLGKKLTHRQARNKSKLQFERRAFKQRGLENNIKGKNLK